MSTAYHATDIQDILDLFDIEDARNAQWIGGYASRDLAKGGAA